MPSEKDEHKVIDLQRAGCLLVEDGNHGEYRPRANEFGSGNTSFIRAADMEGGRILFESADKINDTALARITKGIGRGGDILFSHKGTVGKLALAPLDAPPFVCSPQTTFWRTLDEERIDRLYLYYFMRSRRFWEQWHSRKGETDMADYVSLTAQRELFVVVPHIDQQRTIARILGALDDKIELNRQMNRTLEAMAQALFKSWFVDFDPVTAKAAGHRPYGVDEETAAQFPSHFVESELGLIPEGWRISTIGQETRVVGGTTPSTNEPEFWEGGTIYWATPKDLSKLASPVLLDTERKITEKGLKHISSGLLPTGTVLLSSRAPIGYLAVTEIPVAINQGFIAMVCEDVLSRHYVLRWTYEAMDEILSRAGGTTFSEINKANFRPISVLVPDERILKRYDSIVSQLHEQTVINLQENQTLATLRDSLLPKLLSGEIRVREAEREMEQVV